MPIWIENERGVIGLAVVGSKSWTAFIVATIGQRGRMKGVHRRATGCNQCEMKTGPRGELHAGFGPQEQRNLSPGSRVRRPVADAMFRSPSPNPPERRERRIVEGLGPIEIADAERDVPEHMARLGR